MLLLLLLLLLGWSIGVYEPGKGEEEVVVEEEEEEEEKERLLNRLKGMGTFMEGGGTEELVLVLVLNERAGFGFMLGLREGKEGRLFAVGGCW